MKWFTARCTMAVAVTAWLGLPLTAWSQTPPSTPAPTAQKPSAPAGEQGAALEHITQAKAALNDIPATIPARAKSRIAELKRHLNALEKSASASTPPAANAKKGTQAKANWATDVAAIDKILTELLGPAGTGATGQPTGATGTAGTAAATKSGSAAALTLDETTKTKLMEVRTHVTAFAAAMSGSGARTPDASQPSAADPAAAAAAQPATTPAEPGTPPASPTSPAQNPAAMPAQNPPAAAEQAQQPGAAAQVDPEASKRHLSAARDSLSQLTQLPAAAQLSGEARTQVSQLITNFNELISTKDNWRASYDKVEANLTAILGPESMAAAPPATGTPGAVGTSGAVAAATIDPAIRAKLVEFRSHLTEFQKAAGGGSSSSSAASPASSSTPPSATASPAPTGDPASTPPTAGSAAPASSSAPSTPAEQTPASQQPPSSATQPPSPATGTTGQTSALSHIDAIEAILNGRSAASSSQTTTGATTGAAGTTGSGPASLTLDRSQIEQIRMHLAELRKAVDKK